MELLIFLLLWKGVHMFIAIVVLDFWLLYLLFAMQRDLLALNGLTDRAEIRQRKGRLYMNSSLLFLAAVMMLSIILLGA
jgi:hypothetical protein